MKANSRQVFVYNLEVVTVKKAAVLPTLDSLVSVWNSRRLAGSGNMAISGGDIFLTIGDISVDAANSQAVILIRHSDRYAAESVYSDIAANTFVAHPKAATEGGETGVHVFISLLPEQGTPNQYTCIIEKVPYLDPTMVRRFLNSLLRDEYNSNPAFASYDSPAGQRDRTGAIVRDRCLPRIELDGRPSEHLARDVQQGRLTGVTLIKSIPKTTVGGVPFLLKSEATMKIEVDQHSFTANVWGDVRRALASEAANYSTAQINIRLPNRKKTVSVKVDTEHGAPLNDLYIRSHDINGINPPMRQSSQNIAGQLDARVAPLVRSERNV